MASGLIISSFLVSQLVAKKSMVVCYSSFPYLAIRVGSDRFPSTLFILLYCCRCWKMLLFGLQLKSPPMMIWCYLYVC